MPLNRIFSTLEILIVSIRCRKLQWKKVSDHFQHKLFKIRLVNQIALTMQEVLCSKTVSLAKQCLKKSIPRECLKSLQKTYIYHVIV